MKNVLKMVNYLKVPRVQVSLGDRVTFLSRKVSPGRGLWAAILGPLIGKESCGEGLVVSGPLGTGSQLEGFLCLTRTVTSSQGPFMKPAKSSTALGIFV